MSSQQRLKIYTDGGARGNPGPAAAAWLAMADNQVIQQQATYLGEKTNNIAEYQALLMALEWLNQHLPPNTEQIDFYLDSQLVVKQLLGEFRVKKAHLMPLYQQVTQLLNRLRQQGIAIKINHVPRAENWQADALVNQVLDQQTSE